jgi:hypothetical protein
MQYMARVVGGATMTLICLARQQYAADALERLGALNEVTTETAQFIVDSVHEVELLSSGLAE